MKPQPFWRRCVGLVALACATSIAMAQTAPSQSSYWNFSSYGTTDPASLLQHSIDVEFRPEKLRIRSFLAAKHPNTAEGLASRAWLAGYEKRPDEERRLYQECIQRFPKLMLCHQNLMASTNDLEVAQRMYAQDASYSDFASVRSLHWLYLERGQNSDAEALRRDVAQRFPGRWIVPFLDYQIAFKSKDFQTQRQALQRALATETKVPWLVMPNLIGLETGELFDNQGSRQSIAFKRVMEYLAQTKDFDSFEPWQYLLDNHHNNQPETQIAVLKKHLELFQSGEVNKPAAERRPLNPAVLQYVTARNSATSNPATAPWMAEVRQMFQARRTTEPAVELQLLRWETLTDGDVETVVKRWRTLVDQVPSNVDAADYAGKAVWDLANRQACEAGSALAQEWSPRFDGKGAFNANALQAAMCAGNWSEARRHAELGAANGMSATRRTDLMRVDHAERQAQEWQQYLKRTPFLTQWERSTQGKLSLAIEFPTGSAQLPAAYRETLMKLARTLREGGASDFQFDISGHTDSRGSAALNQRLSEQRAQSVVSFLGTQGGIDVARLVATGHGSAFPVASEGTPDGLQRNRRVEIVPRANLRAPSLAQRGRPTGMGEYSPDGRLMATTDALWDTRSWLRLRDLPSAPIAHQTFTPDGRHLVRLAVYNWADTNDSVIEVVDVATGLIAHRRLVQRGFSRYPAISPDGTRIAQVVLGRLDVYTLPDLQPLAQRMLSPGHHDGSVTWIDNDRMAVNVRWGNEPLQVVNARTLATERSFSDVDYVHTLGVSRSGKTLLAYNNSGRLFAWDTQTWQRRTSDGPGAPGRHFSFHPFEEQAWMDLWNGDAVLLDLGTLKELRRIKKGPSGSHRASFHPTGQQVFVFNALYEPSSMREVSSFAADDGYGPQPVGIRALGQFALADGKDSLLWDVTQGRLIDRVVGKVLCGHMPGQWNLFKDCNADRLIDPLTWETTPLARAKPVDKTEVELGSNLTRTVYFNRDPSPREGRVAVSGKLLFVDRTNGRTVRSVPLFLRTADAERGDAKSLVEGLPDATIDPTGRYIAVRTWWKEHVNYSAVSGRRVWIFDLNSGELVDTVNTRDPVLRVWFTTTGGMQQRPRLRIGVASTTWVYDVLDKKFEEKSLPWTGREAAAAEVDEWRAITQSNRVTLLQGEQAPRFVTTRRTVNSVTLFPAHNLMLVNLGRGEIDFYDLKTLSRQLTVHAREGGEWLSALPSGEYAASLRGAEGYYWALGDKTLAFEALKDRFEKPGAISDRLRSVVGGQASAPETLSVGRLPEPEVRPTPTSTQAPVLPPHPTTQPAAEMEAELFMPPFQLRIIDPPQRLSESSGVLKLGLTRVRAGAPEPGVEAMVNGHVLKLRGLGRVPASACQAGAVGCEQVLSLPVQLENGRNVVQVSLVYRDARLEAQTAVIEVATPQKASASAPRLWLFGAGVSEYKASSQNLKFAHRDVQELAKTFKAQEGKLFSQVNVKLLTDAEVTKGQLETELLRFLRQASAQDLIVVKLAGHGVQDNDQTLYFMTHEATVDEPFTGLDVTNIRTILRNRPPSQKALLLLDICHAGAIGEGRRGRLSAEDAIKQLSEGTGVTVLSSSQGRELSQEGPQFRGGHGAFTAALLEGLEGAADRNAGNRDGVISLTELTTYVMRKVPELTRNAQHPVMPSSERLQDYPMAVAKP